MQSCDGWYSRDDKGTKCSSNGEKLCAETWTHSSSLNFPGTTVSAGPLSRMIADADAVSVLYTGSGRVAKIVLAAAAKHLTSVTTEVRYYPPLNAASNLSFVISILTHIFRSLEARIYQGSSHGSRS